METLNTMKAFRQKGRGTAILGLVLCDSLRCIAFRTLAIWIPYVVHVMLYDPMFLEPGTQKSQITQR